MHVCRGFYSTISIRNVKLSDAVMITLFKSGCFITFLTFFKYFTTYAVVKKGAIADCDQLY